MMTKPNFKDPNPTSLHLRQEQDRLQKQADKMLAETGILDIYSKHCTVNGIGGSYKYGLMVYPDLDLDISAQPKMDKHAFSKLVADLSSNKFVESLRTSDAVNFESSNTWKGGYFLGIVLPYEGDNWGIDCWIQKTGELFYDPKEHDIKFNNLNQEEKDAILLIKYQLIYRNLYGTKYSSFQVYDAVISGGARTADEFLQLNS